MSMQAQFKFKNAEETPETEFLNLASWFNVLRRHVLRILTPNEYWAYEIYTIRLGLGIWKRSPYQRCGALLVSSLIWTAQISSPLLAPWFRYWTLSNASRNPVKILKVVMYLWESRFLPVNCFFTCVWINACFVADVGELHVVFRWRGLTYWLSYY